MGGIRFEPNPDFERELEEMARQQLEPQYNDVLRATVREVRDEMSGQPTDAVYDEIVGRLTTRIPGLRPNEEELRQVASEIEAGTLTD